MTLKSLVIAGLIITLSGCEALMLGNVLVYCATREEPELAVKELPIAKVGRPYSARIDVVHASTGVSKLLVAPAKPLPEGLELSHQARDKHGVISGTPLKTGTYDVLIYGSTFGTQCAGQDVEQLYKIKVMK